MRTFYVFKINREMNILFKESPYNLFKALESIYLMDKLDVGVGKEMLDQLVTPLDRPKYNELIFNLNKDNDFYTKFMNTHRIYNKYRKEETTIVVKNTHILFISNILTKDIRKFLPSNGLFMCDFENKDYFWLEDFVNL